MPSTPTVHKDNSKVQAMDNIMMLLDILHVLDDVDMLGRGIEIKAKIIERIAEETDRI